MLKFYICLQAGDSIWTYIHKNRYAGCPNDAPFLTLSKEKVTRKSELLPEPLESSEACEEDHRRLSSGSEPSLVPPVEWLSTSESMSYTAPRPTKYNSFVSLSQE